VWYLLSPVAQFIAVCSASTLAEKRHMSSPFSSQSRENRRPSSRPTRAYIHQFQPPANADKLSDPFRRHRRRRRAAPPPRQRAQREALLLWSHRYFCGSKYLTGRVASLAQGRQHLGSRPRAGPQRAFHRALPEGSGFRPGPVQDPDGRPQGVAIGGPQARGPGATIDTARELVIPPRVLPVLQGQRRTGQNTARGPRARRPAARPGSPAPGGARPLRQ